MQTLIDHTDRLNKGLSCNEYSICDIIYQLTMHDGKTTISTISKELGFTKLLLMRLINKLIEKGFVVRDSNKRLVVDSQRNKISIKMIPNENIEGIKTIPQGIKTIPEGIKTIPQGIKTIPQGIKTIPEGIKTIPEGIKTIPEGIKTIPNDNTPLKNIIVNNQSTQHIKEKLYKYDKSFYENYLSIKNKKEDTDTPTDNIVGPVQETNTTSSEEYIPTQITVLINDIIELIKTKCKENNIMYTGKTKERFFAKHLLSDKFKKECLDIFPYTLNQFIEGIIPLSNKLKYAKTLSSAQDIYYNRANVINTAQKQKAQAQDQKTSIDLRTHK